MSRFMMQVGGHVRPLSFDGGAAAPPLLSSGATPWAGIPFELHRSQPFEGERDSGPPSGQQTMLVLVEGATEVAFRERGREVYHQFAPGSMSLHSAEDRPVVTRARGHGSIMAVRLTEPWRERLLHEGAPDSFGYQPPSPPDEVMRSLASAMCAEVARGAPSGALFAESLSLAMLSYALERIPTQRSHRMHVRGALSDGQQRRLRRYIEERLQDNLRLSELASLCGLRPRHFSTLFRRAFGVSPHRYVMERRLARGAELLATTGYDIGEVSLRVGFCSSSHFASEFRKAYAQTPRQYAMAERGGSARVAAPRS